MKPTTMNQNENAEPESPAPAGKSLFGVGMLAAGIAAGAMFAPVGLAGAQVDDEAESTEDGGTSGRFGRFADRSDVLESLGIDTDAIQAGIAADQTLVEVAEASGVTEAELVAAIESELDTRVAAAVERGRLTQEEADEKFADVSDRLSEAVNTVLSERSGRSGRSRLASSEVLEELGLTIEDIRAGYEAGQTLAETAEANGVSETDLVDALVAAAVERAEAAVEAGRLDADAVAERLEGLEERITERVTAEPGERFSRGGRGNRGDRGLQSEADAEVEESSITF